MSTETRIRALTLAETAVWRPRLFDLSKPRDREAVQELLDRGEIQRAHDMIGDQLAELVAVRSPSKRMTTGELQEAVADFLGGRSAFEYGTWVYYPWSRALVHVLPEGEYRELRSSRNRYKISRGEHDQLISAKIGVVGLSVGLASAVTLLMESVGGEYRLADFDQLALSNMNRLRTASHHIGVNKCVIAAREMTEIDPYTKVKIFERGLNEENVEDFLAGGGPLDLVVEECDDLFMKLFVRERARARKIPVIMETNERGMLDIERFDLEPDRRLLHGLVEDVRAAEVKGLSTPEKAPFVLRIIGMNTMSDRMQASLLEVGRTITSWPQLASGVMLGGALTTHAARKILLGQSKESGRYFADLDTLVRDGAAAPLQVDRSIDEVLQRRQAPLQIPPLARSSFGPAISANDIRTLVSYATLAPSAGNAQPWRVIARGSTLRFTIDQSRGWQFLDYKRSATHVAFGAAVENLSLAAAAMGLRADVYMFPDPGDPGVVCEVDLSPVEGASTPPLAPHIARRVTNRRRSRRVPLSEVALYDLSAAAEEAGARLLLLTEPAALDEIAALIGASERLMYMSEIMHRDTARELRWTQSEVEGTRHGVDVATLELSPPEVAAFRVAMSWPGMAALRSVGAGRGLGDGSKRSIDVSSAVGVVVGEGTSPEAYFSGGRALERVWLTATAHELALHPISGMIYLFARLEQGRGEGFSESEIETIRGLRERYLKLFQIEPGREAEVLLFRLSVADPPRIRSLRLPVEEVLSFEEAAPWARRKVSLNKPSMKPSKKTRLAERWGRRRSLV